MFRPLGQLFSPHKPAADEAVAVDFLDCLQCAHVGDMATLMASRAPYSMIFTLRK